MTVLAFSQDWFSLFILEISLQEVEEVIAGLGAGAGKKLERTVLASAQDRFSPFIT